MSFGTLMFKPLNRSNSLKSKNGILIQKVF